MKDKYIEPRLSVNYLLLAFLFFGVLFSLDGIVNAFVPLPLGAFSIIIFVAMAFIMPIFLKLEVRLWIFYLLLFFSLFLFILRVFYIDGASRENLSDLFFFYSFIVSCYFFYIVSGQAARVCKLRLSLSALALMSFLLFLPSLLGYEFYEKSLETTLSYRSDDLEFSRGYRQGFFRYPHVASYFFSVLAIGFFLVAKTFSRFKFKGLFFLIISLACFCLAFLTGSRAGVYGVLVFLLVYYSLRSAKSLISVVVIACFLSFVLLSFLEVLLNATFGNVAYQYLSFFHTLINDFERASRVIIWRSWLSSYEDLSFFYYLFGRSYESSLVYNMENIGHKIWFHNDFLSVMYVYGFFGLVLLVASFFFLQSGLNRLFGRRVSISLVVFFIFMAFTNGLYYYYFNLLIFALISTSFYTLRDLGNE